MANEERTPAVGEAVIFTDPYGVDHDALVTCVHTPSCINIVRVSDDPNSTDQYGRQLNRVTSVSLVSEGSAHGNYFRFSGMEKKPFAPPLDT